MTDKELSVYCLDNAGLIATGRDKEGKPHTGRIIAYAPSKAGGWILIEDKTLAKKKLPDPLPSIPHKEGSWFCLIANCHLGAPCLADSVKIVAATNTHSLAQDKTIKHIPQDPSVEKPCGHNTCYVDWCTKSYAGFV